MSAVAYAPPGSWSRLTNVFGTCMSCQQPGKPLFAYQLADDHIDTFQPWTDENLCMVNRDDFDGCYWCAWPKDQPFMVCPRCFGEQSALERAALDAAR